MANLHPWTNQSSLEVLWRTLLLDTPEQEHPALHRIAALVGPWLLIECVQSVRKQVKSGRSFDAALAMIDDVFKLPGIENEPLDRASLKAFCSQPEDPAAPNGVEGRFWAASKSCLESHATARAENASKLATRCLFAALNGLFGGGPRLSLGCSRIYVAFCLSAEDAQRKLHLRIY
jgi:hypothetical protein